MAEADGPSGRWSPDRYARDGEFVSRLGRPLIGLLRPRAGERILDLGCGDGALTAELARTAAIVVGLDADPAMVAAARTRGLTVECRRAEDLAAWIAADRVAAFDAVFSNAAMHWMPDLPAVVDGAHAALRPGGRFVGEFGGFGNVAAVHVALTAAAEAVGLNGPALSPWTFPTGPAFAAMLTRSGFVVHHLQTFARPTALPTDLAGWIETLAGPYLSATQGDRRRRLIELAVRFAGPALRSPAGIWVADYVRLRFAAVRPT